MFQRHRGAAAALAALLSVAAGASAPQPQTPYLRGRVIDADTAAPLAGVTITLSGRERHILTTDADGGYQSPTLKPGLYDLSARKDGYLPSLPMWGDETPLRLHVNEEGIGPAVIQREWMLERASRIRGRLLDAAGRPIEGADVHAAVRRIGKDGWPLFDLRGSSKSGADGRFVIGGLARGPHVIAYRVGSEAGPRWFFSPGIPDPRHASQIEATPNDLFRPAELRAATVDLPPVAVRARTGTRGPAPDTAIEVILWSPFPDLNPSQRVIGGTPDRNGVATFDRLPVGRHRVIARSPASLELPAAARGEAALLLPESVVNGVDVRLQPAINACVHTRIEEASLPAADPRPLPIIIAQPNGFALSGERPVAQVPLGGALRLPGVARGSQISLRPLAQEMFWGLSRFTPVRADTMRGHVPADASMARCATAYFRRTAHTISGRVDLPDQEWLPHVEVIATPIDSPAAPLAVAVVGPDLGFRLTGIADDMRYAVTAVPAGMRDTAVSRATRVLAVGGDTIVVPLSLPIAR